MKSIFRSVFPYAAAIVVLFPALSWAWQGKVISIPDGDTILILHDGKEEKIRLYGIDSPEQDQAFGRKAKQFTSKAASGKTVEVVPMDQDDYGRTVALVYVTGEGKSLNEKIVEAGFAWVYRSYCRKPDCKSWLQLEDEARRDQKGLWADSDPVPPWKFRHKYRGNVLSKVFHRPGCKYYNCKNCTADFKTREEAVAAGYKPCEICDP